MRRIYYQAIAALLVLSCVSFTLAQTPLQDSVPNLSSRPGAPYTIFLNVTGFDYNGTWLDETPGYTPPLNDRALSDAYSADEVTQIKAIWSRVAQSFAGFDVNVTTVDPAPTGMTDAQRQDFYDSTANMMHTVIGSELRDDGMGGMSSWEPGESADGLSGLDVVAGTNTEGRHTNFMLASAQAGASTGFVINGDYIGAVSSHENGHAFGLDHQSDYSGMMAMPINEYTVGDASSGDGSYVAIMGNASDRQRVTWRVGDSNVSENQEVVNSVQRILATNNTTTGAGRPGTVDLHFIDDGIGHSSGTATPLPVDASGNVDSGQAKGVIVPNDEINPNPLGASNYTEDWFSFVTDGMNPVTLTATNGTSFLVDGVADGVGPLRSELCIFDTAVTLVDCATEDGSTLFSTYTDTLTAGTYYAKITSFGGHEQDNPDFNDAQYYDMGAYFLSGSGFLVPEPASSTWLLCSFVSLFLVRRRR